MADMDDLLNDPEFPERPQHPDFWRLSEIILQMSAPFDEVEGEASHDIDFEKFVGEEIDPASIFYMAAQRVLRLKGMGFQDEGKAIAALYLEGFLLGCKYGRRYGATTEEKQ